MEKIAELATHDEGQKFRVLEETSGKVTQLDCHAEVVDLFSEKCYALGKVCKHALLNYHIKSTVYSVLTMWLANQMFLIYMISQSDAFNLHE